MYRITCRHSFVWVRTAMLWSLYQNQLPKSYILRNFDYWITARMSNKIYFFSKQYTTRTVICPEHSFAGGVFFTTNQKSPLDRISCQFIRDDLPSWCDYAFCYKIPQTWHIFVAEQARIHYTRYQRQGKAFV